MEIATMPQRWDDDRLDELGHRVDKGFALVDQRFEQVDERFKQIDQRFEQIDERFKQVDRRFEQIDQRFDRLEEKFEIRLGTEIGALRTEVNNRLDRLIQTTMITGGGIIATLVATCVTALLAV